MLSTTVFLLDLKDLVRWETWRPEWGSGSSEVGDGTSRCSVEVLTWERLERKRVVRDEMELESQQSRILKRTRI